MTWRAKFSRFVARWVQPADAARVVSKHGAEARKRTSKEIYDDFHARLRAEVEAKRTPQA